ncbi:unnamed protein product [Coregonus sp. 'balchen']|nr:unnamed protein product [Coregonus sp. 'balchen']
MVLGTPLQNVTVGGNTAVGDVNLVSTDNNTDNLRPSSPQLRPLPYDPDTPVKPQGKKMRGQETDKVTQEKLWLMVAAVRKAGKTAFFVGAGVIIDGKEMRPNQNI